MTTTPPDPLALFGQLLAQWTAINGTAGDAARSTLPGTSGAATTAQAMGRQVIERALAATNMPSRTELEDLSARIGRVEAALFRIEALLHEGRATTAGADPASLRQPPE